MSAILENLGNVSFSPSEWTRDTSAYRFYVQIIAEEDTGFSAIALNLPGTGSCGDTEQEALENFQEAARGALASYLEAGDTIPWVKEAKSLPSGGKWITVHV